VQVLHTTGRYYRMIAAEKSARPEPKSACLVAIEAHEDAQRHRVGAIAAAHGHTVALPRGDDELDHRRPGCEPDVVVLVAISGGPQVPQAIRAARDRLPETAIVLVLPGPGTPSDLRKALKAGADGIVLAEELERALAPTLDAVRHGQVAVPRSLRGHVIRQPLSYREKQILGMVVMGFTNRQIANELYLAESTVKTHLSSAFGKLNARSRAEAAAMILDPDEDLAPGILSLVPGRVTDA
jgi:DNA-binding NarL/FixJ family response regulator